MARVVLPEESGHGGTTTIRVEHSGRQAYMYAIPLRALERLRPLLSRVCEPSRLPSD